MSRKKELIKLDNLVTKASRKILSISSIFPFQLFPDTLNIDENKVDIIHREFFFTNRIAPILIKDILAVNASRNLFFGTLEVEVSGFHTKPGPITQLWAEDAVRARRIIVGLISANKEEIDLAQIPTSQLRHKLEEIGRSHDSSPA